MDAPQGIHMKGVLPWLVRWSACRNKRFCRALDLGYPSWPGTKYGFLTHCKSEGLENCFTKYMTLFKLHGCISLETSLKRPRQLTCHSKSS
jgi:hypothetical protein